MGPEPQQSVESTVFHRRYRPRPLARRTIENEIEIAAPIDVVWDILAQFDRYAEWNPFTPAIRGELEVGRPIDIEVSLLRDRPFIQREWLNLIDPGKTLCWGMHMFNPWLLTTNRWQQLSELSTQSTRYHNRLELSGLLTPTVMMLYREKLTRSFSIVAQALKTRCEE